MSNACRVTDGQQQRRRTAGRRILALLLAGLAAQIGGWALTAGHPAAQGALLLTLAAAMYAGVGLLGPLPPGEFAWPRTLRRRRPGPRTRRTPPDGGIDLLGVAALLAGILPWPIVSTWLEERELGYPAEVLLLAAVVVAGNGLMFGVIALRRRRAAEPSSPDDAPPPPGTALFTDAPR